MVQPQWAYWPREALVAAPHGGAGRRAGVGAQGRQLHAPAAAAVRLARVRGEAKARLSAARRAIGRTHGADAVAKDPRAAPVHRGRSVAGRPIAWGRVRHWTRAVPGLGVAVRGRCIVRHRRRRSSAPRRAPRRRRRPRRPPPLPQRTVEIVNERAGHPATNEATGEDPEGSPKRHQKRPPIPAEPGPIQTRADTPSGRGDGARNHQTAPPRTAAAPAT